MGNSLERSHDYISVITPARNPGRLILETFSSLENQSFKNFEWIIIDDFSDSYDQKYFDQIKSRASFSVKICRNFFNKGQARSKNTGIELANGKYIKFLDADDLLDRYHLQNQLALFNKTNIVQKAIFSPTVNFWKKGNKLLQKKNNSFKIVPTTNFEQLKRFLVFPFFSHCGCLFLKEDLVSIGGFDENLITDEDGDLILRLMCEGMLFIPEENSHYYYRQHLGERVSNDDSEEKWNDRLNVCLKINSILDGKNIELQQQLAQRVDLLGMRRLIHSKDRANMLFKTAQNIYSNYSYPGNWKTRLLRNLMGSGNFVKLKSRLNKL